MWVWRGRSWVALAAWLAWAALPGPWQTPVWAATLAQDLAGMRQHPVLAQVLSDPRRYELQIRRTRLEQDREGQWRTHSEHYGVDPGAWFAAASLVKLPMAVQALEQLAADDLPRDTRLWAAPVEGCTPALALADTPPAFEPLERLLTRMLVVSDNESFNRLYAWLGPPLPQQRFRRLGFARAHITRPLMRCTDAARGRLAAWSLQAADDTPVQAKPERAARDRPRFAGPRVLRGQAWLEDGVLKPGPYDFSDSNYLPLALVEAELMRVVRPELLPEHERSGLREPDRLWLRQILATTPPQVADPRYPADPYTPHWAKFLVVGDGRAWPEGLRIYNKVGQSYGYLSDVAYLEDTRNGRAVFLSAVLSVDLDGVLNDGRYAYDTLGLPFLAELGARLWALEHAPRTAPRAASLRSRTPEH